MERPAGRQALRRPLIALSLAAAVTLLLAVARTQLDPARAGLAAPRPAAGLSNLQHIVIIMQENRSFDHYFGTFPGADGLPKRCQRELHGLRPRPVHR